MRLVSAKIVAFFKIYLLLSANPIQAVHISETVSNLGESEQLVNELKRALHEDTHGLEANATEEYIGETFASCAQRLQDFDRRTDKTWRLYQMASEDGTITVGEAAKVILKARKVAKTLSAAQKKKCDWVGDKKAFNASKMQAIVTGTAGKVKCFEATKAHLEKAKNGNADKQKASLIEAMSIYLSDDCKPSEESKSASAGPKPSTEELMKMQEADEEEFNANEESMVKGAEARDDPEDEMEPELEEDAPKGVAGAPSTKLSASQAPDAPEDDAPEGVVGKVKNSLIQLVDGLETQDQMQEMLVKMVGFIFLVVLWTFFCWFAAAILIVVLGLIMCLFKIVITAFIRLFGAKAWNFDYGECMNWWLSALGHSNVGQIGEAGVSLCAIGFMTSVLTGVR